MLDGRTEDQAAPVDPSDPGYALELLILVRRGGSPSPSGSARLGVVATLLIGSQICFGWHGMGGAFHYTDWATFERREESGTDTLYQGEFLRADALETGADVVVLRFAAGHPAIRSGRLHDGNLGILLNALYVAFRHGAPDAQDRFNEHITRAFRAMYGRAWDGCIAVLRGAELEESFARAPAPRARLHAFGDKPGKAAGGWWHASKRIWGDVREKVWARIRRAPMLSLWVAATVGVFVLSVVLAPVFDPAQHLEPPATKAQIDAAAAKLQGHDLAVFKACLGDQLAAGSPVTALDIQSCSESVKDIVLPAEERAVASAMHDPAKAAAFAQCTAFLAPPLYKFEEKDCLQAAAAAAARHRIVLQQRAVTLAIQ